MNLRWLGLTLLSLGMLGVGLWLLNAGAALASVGLLLWIDLHVMDWEQRHDAKSG